ncbi:MAG TPA: 50S ribosomal protein L17 [Blastocatellia bacterium]|nr:50S ribosomal protein L17 [Blastocatellia bacterium]
MRHRVAHRKLGRKTEHRLALLRNLCTSLITHERLITTLPKAKELRPFAERAITLGKRALAAEVPEAALHKRRLAAAYFFSGNTNRLPDGGYKRPRAPRTAGVAALDKLFDEVASRYAERPGGYTRILKLGARRGDGAEMALIELIGSETKQPHAEEKKDEKKKGRRLFGRRKREGGSDAKETGEQKPAGRSAKPAASGKSNQKSSKKTDSDADNPKPKTRGGKKVASE